MTVTDGVAVYAAIVATGGLLWQVARDAGRTRTRLEVVVKMGGLTFPGRVVEAVIIEIRNRSEHPVQVVAAGIFDQHHPEMRIQTLAGPRGNRSLPEVVQPKDAYTVWIELAELPSGFDVTNPVQGWARAAAGEAFTSTRAPLLRRS